MNRQIQNIRKKFVLEAEFIGWGRKKSGQKAVELAQKYDKSFLLLEDGFIRSVGLGDDEAFSIVKDNIGIYYDATAPSRLEEILKSYDFDSDTDLMQKAREAISLLKTCKISKYNTGALELPNDLKTDTKKVLIIAQTAGDMSLQYGYGDEVGAKQMLLQAIEDNPDAEVYVKIHPDVLAGKKASNIDVDYAKRHCHVIEENIHPMVLLEAFDKVYTQTSQMGFEALMLGKEVHIFGAPFYVGWDTPGLHWHLPDKIKSSVLARRGVTRSVEELFAAAYILYSRYYNPYMREETDIFDAIKTIHKYRTLEMENSKAAYVFGIPALGGWSWKKRMLNAFISSGDNRVSICKTLTQALRKGLDPQSRIYIWGRKSFEDVESYAKEHGIPLYRIEDGFIRSVTLGSDLTRPYSLVVDSRGIYFDPTRESDLEYLLNTYEFDGKLLDRSRRLQRYLVEKKLSKYNASPDRHIELPGHQKQQKIILVPGQVEDDASIIYGAQGMSNLELLQKTRELEPDAYIIYKPHPDVLAGNRKGDIPESLARNYADTVITDVSLDSVLELCDEVHTMTSLVGFEALIRGKKVTTHGMPFYAGWGLTRDFRECQRRKRKRSLDELAAAAYILYPRYLHPDTDEPCEIEELLREIEKEKKRYTKDRWYRLRIDVRNWFSRKGQLILKLLLGEWERR